MHQVKTRHSQVLDFGAVKQVPLDAQHFKTHELSTFQRFTRIPRDRLKKPFWYLLLQLKKMTYRSIRFHIRKI